jgi:hypothetical protein
MDLRFCADVSMADTEYGAVLLDERSGQYWQLNPTGALAVRLLLAGSAQSEVATALAGEFQVDEQQAAQDVRALVEQLRSAGLVG